MENTILLVDDHPVFRKGLRLLLEEEPDLNVAGEAGDGQEAVDRVRELSPDLVVMDITMPNLNGIDATRQILSESPDTKVVGLSIHSGKGFVEDMLRAGANGYILKDNAPEELVKGIRAVAQGDVYLSASITGIVVSQYLEAMTEVDGAESFNDQPLIRQASRGAAAVEITFPAIIGTKLHPPSVTEDLVARPRLVELIDQGRECPLTVVSAPAGYGKTTLVAQWLQGCELPRAWVSLDDNDNDLYSFLNYFVTALERLFPDTFPKTRTLLNGTILPPVPALAGSLINEMDRIEQDFILVLDDIHWIRKPSVNDLLTELLRHPPQTTHLVMLGRRDPFLPLAALRARKQLTEIRVRDLRFSVEEAAAYLEKMLGERIDEATAASWSEKTEGWVTGLRLESLSMRYRDDAKNMLAEHHGSAQYVTEYLFDEVLSQQPPEVLQYLMNTAILKRFCAPLCDALKGEEFEPGQDDIDGGRFISSLKKENMFIINLDSENRWFRYHNLFQQLLEKHLKRRRSPEDIAALHARAGDWFAENGLIEEALWHTLAAADFPSAVQLFEKHRLELMKNEQWKALERILRLFPHERVETHPELLMMKTWMLFHGYCFSKMTSALNRAESLIDSMPSETASAGCLRGEMLVMRSAQCCATGDGRGALSHAKQALDILPLEHVYAREWAEMMQCRAHQMNGDLTLALKVAYEGIEQDAPQEARVRARMLNGLCFIRWMEADLSGLQQTAMQYLEHGRANHLPESTSNARLFLAVQSYQRNDPAGAEKHLVPNLDDFYTANAITGIQSCIALALVYEGQNRTEKARELADTAIAFALESQNTTLIHETQAFQAELALRQGRLSEAFGWARQFVPEPFQAMEGIYVPQLTQVKVLLAEGTSESRQQAADLLDRLHDFVLSIHNTRVRIDILALQALLHHARGEEPGAMEKLTEALNLAEPGGFIRNFVDMGPSMAELMVGMIRQNTHVVYIGKLLAAFRDCRFSSGDLRFESEALNPIYNQKSKIENSFIDPLTKREAEIMDLLTQRLYNNEIAEKLFISTETVKKHLYNIYQKFNVNTRRQAVEKAQALGMLSSS